MCIGSQPFKTHVITQFPEGQKESERDRGRERARERERERDSPIARERRERGKPQELNECRCQQMSTAVEAFTAAGTPMSVIP